MNSHTGEYHYTACGLDNVYLVGGVEFVEGPRGKQVVIRDIDGLHKVIGHFLVNEKRDLTGREFRFLRHEMQMSQSTLASLLEVAEQTVHRWETGKTAIPKPVEALIRLLYNEHSGNNEKIRASLKRIAALEDEIDKKMRLGVRSGGGWALETKKAA